MLAVSIIFLLALVLIAILFGVKNWEVNHGRVLAPQLRARADAQALELKKLAQFSMLELQKLPPFLAYAGRLAVHEGALGFARLMRSLEQQAHDVADLVSHKRSFTPRESHNEFLKRMSEHGNGTNGDHPTDQVDQ